MSMTATQKIKLGVCIALDVFDFTIGRIPGVGVVTELMSAAVACAMFGKAGLWVAVELLDVTEQFDGFVPICTIIGWKSISEQNSRTPLLIR